MTLEYELELTRPPTIKERFFKERFSYFDVAMWIFIMGFLLSLPTFILTWVMK